MTSELDLQDKRVPSFIPFDSDPPAKVKKVTKRKRKSQAEPKPVTKKPRRRLPKHGTLDAFITKEVTPVKPKDNHIWVGAVAKKEYGAYGVYFGENDDRNFGSTFVIKEELHNTDYGHVLGTLNAINALEPNNESFVINVSCRGLPQAIANSNKKYHYKDLTDEIRHAIISGKHGIYVRHISARSNSEEHKLAIELASEAINKLNEISEKSKITEQDDTDDVVMEETVANETVVESIVDGDLGAEDAMQEDTLSEAALDDVLEKAVTFVDLAKNAVAENHTVEDEAVVNVSTTVKDTIDEEHALNFVVENVITPAAAAAAAENLANNDEPVESVTTVVEESTKVVATEIEKDDITVKDNTIEVEVITNEITLTEKITIEETQIDDLNVREIESIPSSSHDTKITTTVAEKDAECTASKQGKETETKEASSWASVLGIRGLLDVLYSPFKSRKP